MPSRSEWRWLLEKEFRELAASRAFWLLLIVTGALVGHAIMSASELYAEASGIGGGPSALSQGLSPLEGIVVPTLGAYDLAATLLFPFVVIRLVAVEKQSGALALMLQAPTRFGASIVGEGHRAARRVGRLAARRRRGARGVDGDRRPSVRAGDVDGRTRLPAARRSRDRHRCGGRRARGQRGQRGDHRAHGDDRDVGAGLRRGGARRNDRRDRAVHADLRAARRSSTAICACRRFSSCTTIGLAGLGVAAAWLREGRHLSRRVGRRRGRADRRDARLRRLRAASRGPRRERGSPQFVLAGRRSRAASHRRAAARSRSILPPRIRASRTSIAACWPSFGARCKSVSVEYAAQSRSGLVRGIEQRTTARCGTSWAEKRR